MSSDTGPLASEVHHLREEVRAARGVNYGIQTPTNGNGKAALYPVALGISGFLAVALLGIFGWVAVHVMAQQDKQSDQNAELSRRLATVEAKLDILVSQKNAKQ